MRLTLPASQHHETAYCSEIKDSSSETVGKDNIDIVAHLMPMSCMMIILINSCTAEAPVQKV